MRVRFTAYGNKTKTVSLSRPAFDSPRPWGSLLRGVAKTTPKSVVLRIWTASPRSRPQGEGQGWPESIRLFLPRSRQDSMRRARAATQSDGEDGKDWALPNRDHVSGEPREPVNGSGGEEELIWRTDEPAGRFDPLLGRRSRRVNYQKAFLVPFFASKKELAERRNMFLSFLYPARVKSQQD